MCSPSDEGQNLQITWLVKATLPPRTSPGWKRYRDGVVIICKIPPNLPMTRKPPVTYSITCVIHWIQVLNRVDPCEHEHKCERVHYYYFYYPPHTCLPLRLYRICSGKKSSKSIGRSGNADSLSKVPDSVIHETTTTNTTFLILPESSIVVDWAQNTN